MRSAVDTTLAATIAFALLAGTPVGRAETARSPVDLAAVAAALEQNGAVIVPKARRQMSDGTYGYVPQTGSNYDAVWLRDYFYVLEARLVPSADLVPMARTFLKGMSPEGHGVDCIRYSGEPIYKPGYGRMGEHPVADGPQFTVNVVYETWRQTGDSSLLASNVLDRLRQSLSTLPRNPSSATGLVWIDPSKPWDRCPYGFTDTVRKQGECLFESLLEIQASRNLATMLDAANRRGNADALRAQADREADQVNAVFWDESVGLYRAATVKCREHDIWGSAFAVWLGVAPAGRAKRIGSYFCANFNGLVQHGQVRHTPANVYWEQACRRDSYQNGGFWGTPVGWFAYALERASPTHVERLYGDLLDYYAVHGFCEWSFGSTVAIPDGYLASVAQPLVGLRRILAERQK